MFDWKPELSVQIPAIDAQHKKLFSLAKDLNDAMAQGKGKAVLERALATLVAYTKEHFASEEAFMRQNGFPDSAAHKVQHDALTKQVLDFQDRFRSQETCLTVSLMEFLKTWLEKHISGSDQKYSAHIRGKVA